MINYCKRHGIKIINDGIAAYQKDFPEQRMIAKEYFVDFMNQYGILYNSPIYDFAQSADDVKYRLLQLGVSTKSLEGISIFADSFSTPADETILSYIKRKEQICRDVIQLLIGYSETNHRQRGTATKESTTQEAVA